MIAAEAILRQTAAFLAAPEPVRLRTTLAAGPCAESGARMQVKAVAERVIPQVDRIGGAIAQVSVFLNPDARGLFIDNHGAPPKLTGEIAGYPIYNGWVLITKDGRLPCISQDAGVAPDPTFPDFHDPNRIQVIAVHFSFEFDPRDTARRQWGQQTRETFDWAALARLLK